MALETGTYISDLNSANPSSTDSVSQADDHLRLVKATIKATFPNVTGAVTKTHSQINDLLEKAGGTMTGALTLSGAPSSNLHAATKLYVDTADATKVDTTRTITAGTGLSGGGDLSANRTISVASGGITATQLASDAVTTAKILDANVTAAKLASGAAVSNIGYTPVNPSAFTGSNQSLDTSGYQKLPGGLTIQWGTFTQTSGGYTDVTFPTAFATACVHANVVRLESGDTGGGTVSSILRSLSTTTASFSVSNGYTYHWFALGY